FDLGTTAYQSTDEQRMQVTIQGNSVLVSQTASVFAQGTGTWYTSQSFAFVADSATTTLKFQDVSPTTINIDLLLDNVGVTGGGGSTPTDLRVTVTDGKTAAIAGQKDTYTIVVTNS